MKKLFLTLVLALLIPGVALAGSKFNDNYTEYSYNSQAQVTKTASYTATLSDDYIKVTASTAALTITLPAINTIAGGGFGSKGYKILKTDATAYHIIVAPSSTANTIDGTTGYRITKQSDFIVITAVAGTTDWKVSYGSEILKTDVATGVTTLGGELSYRTSHTLDTATLALTLDDCGSIRMIATDAKTYTLPDTVDVGPGCEFTFVNTGADDAVLLTVSPDDTTADGIYGTCAAVVFTGTDDGDMTNTKSGANNGDWSRIVSDGVDGWYVIGCDGVWAGA
ncbi:MAG: hypothetical protein V3V88_03460 [Dehalococcoidia bacterium]